MAVKIFDAPYNLITKKDSSTFMTSFNDKVYLNYDFSNKLFLYCKKPLSTDITSVCIIYSFKEKRYFDTELNVTKFDVKYLTTKPILSEGCSNFRYFIDELTSVCGLLGVNEKNIICQNLFFDMFGVIQDSHYDRVFEDAENQSYISFLIDLLSDSFYMGRFTSNSFAKQMSYFDSLRGGGINYNDISKIRKQYFVTNVCQFFERIIQDLISNYFRTYPSLTKYGELKDQIFNNKFSFRIKPKFMEFPYRTTILAGFHLNNYTQESTKLVYAHKRSNAFCLMVDGDEVQFDNFVIVPVNGTYLSNVASKIGMEYCYFLNHNAHCNIICEKLRDNTINKFFFGASYPSREILEKGDVLQLHFDLFPFNSYYFVGLNYQFNNLDSKCENQTFVFNYHTGLIENIRKCQYSLKQQIIISHKTRTLSCESIFCINNLRYYGYFCLFLIFSYPIFYIAFRSLMNLINIFTSLISLKMKYFNFRLKKFNLSSKVPIKTCFYRLRFYLFQYLFILHLVLQLLMIFLSIPYYIMILIMKKKFMMIFPFTFYFGNAACVKLEGYVEPCRPFHVGDWCDLNGYHHANESYIQNDAPALNSRIADVNIDHLNCESLYGLDIVNKKDHFINTVQLDSETLLAENCDGDKCQYERIYQSSENIYQCNRLQIKKKDGSSVIIVINDINDIVKHTTLGYYVPFATHDNHEPLTCGHSLCTDNLLQMNKQVCKEGCFSKFGCENDDFQDSECFKNPFRHVFVKNNLQSAVRLYNTGFSFSCSTNNLCYSPKYNVYGTTKREVMKISTYKESRHNWFFALLKLSSIVFNMDLTIIADSQTFKQKITSFDKNIFFNGGLKIEFDVDWKNEEYDTYILVGFDALYTGVVTKVVYRIEEPNDVTNFFGHSCSNGVVSKGIDSGCSFRDNTINDLDIDFKSVIEKLDSKFVRIKSTDDFGYVVQISNTKTVNTKSVNNQILDELKSDFKDYSIILDTNVELSTVGFLAYRHFLTYGLLKVKATSKESFVKHHTSKDVLSLKFLNCSGHNMEVDGFNFCLKRLDDGILPGILKCRNKFEDLTVVSVPVGKIDFCHVFSSDILTDVICDQISPIVKNEKRVEFECSYNTSMFENRPLSPHVRDGIIYVKSKFGFGEMLTEAHKIFDDFLQGFGLGWVGFIPSVIVLVLCIVISLKLFT